MYYFPGDISVYLLLDSSAGESLNGVIHVVVGYGIPLGPDVVNQPGQNFRIVPWIRREAA